MEYSGKFFIDFLKKLEDYSAECEKIIQSADEEIKAVEQRSATTVSAERQKMVSAIDVFTNKKRESLQGYEHCINEAEKAEESRRLTIHKRITELKTKIAEIDNQQSTATEKKIKSHSADTTDLVSLRNEVATLENSLYDNQTSVDAKRTAGWNSYVSKCDSLENEKRDMALKNANDVFNIAKKMKIACNESTSGIINRMEKALETKTSEFHQIYPPAVLEQEFFRIYNDEPQIDGYTCKRENPTSVKISDLVYNLEDLSIGVYAVAMLNRDYFFLTKYIHSNRRNEVIKVPHCITFDKRFNYLFEIDNSVRQLMINRICSIAMRLFMMLPPNKVNFTFFDPITLGETFAMFTRLVDVDDRTSKVINGKIWTSADDITDKMRVITDHIANVTQRCLQGQYENIQEYNSVAGQNAEPYQVLMVMDFPAGFNENSLKQLEQIIITGPKCGVFTILMRSAEQYAKVDEKRMKPLVDNILNNVTKFIASGENIVVDKIAYRDKKVAFDVPKFLSNEELDKVVPILKSGIKNAEKIVVGFDNIIPNKNEWFKGDCSTELSIPIGVHGANNIQNLTFGVGGSHHALVAGQTGSGKSSLLHTVIMSALVKYPANQLHVFLVDFKRGVEFKIYANYSLQAFRVVAVESEREFGGSVLEFLDKEQSRRADMFKRLNVDNVEDYRNKSGDTLPRILLIVDEFHVLFSKDSNDATSKNSAAFLEQIIRQGRAFGIHVILASQTMTNIGGISYGVWGQVGVRIALKCPKSDAKFVLGNDNDGVDLLSTDNPGQAVYNSDCGNVIANTIFRVAYIDQDEQDEYLQYISEHTSKYDYPETRVMLSNVEDNIYHPFQKFAHDQKVDFRENAILIGEPLRLANNMRMTFRKKQSSNMLVIGNDEHKARTLFTFAALSMALHRLSIDDSKKPDRPCTYLFDYAPLEDYYEKDVLLELVRLLPSYVKYVTADDANDDLEDLYEDFTRREKKEAEHDDTYLLVYGLQRARDLRSNNIYQNKNAIDDFDEFGGNIKQQLSVKPYEMFLNLLQRGATVGINSLIWEDNLKIFMTHYANMLSNFDMRVCFNMPDEDSINFIEEPNGSKIGENGAVYSYNGNHKFRPYKKPDLNWLTQLCNKIEGSK